jgi:flagellar FliJ protein
MTTIQTLNKVVEIAERRRDVALAALAQLQREMQTAQDQMDQLEAYALEARTRWQARTSSTGVDAALLHHHRHFMQKIEHAIEFQRGVLRSREDMIEQHQDQVRVAERDLAGLRKFTERKLLAQVQLGQRRDQKQTDELALAIHLRQSLTQAAARSGA